MKIIKTILISIIALSFVVPAQISQPKSVKAVETVKAAGTSQKYYNRYRKDLEMYLNNYLGRNNSGDHGGCIRTPTRLNGTTTDCLSYQKIIDILAQLDKDLYFTDKFYNNPVNRRKYLLTTTRQSYAMSKVVMYFEQILNHDTWIYQGNQTGDTNRTGFGYFTTALNQEARKSALPGIATLMKITDAPYAGIIQAYAFAKTGTSTDKVSGQTYPIYSLRQKAGLIKMQEQFNAEYPNGSPAGVLGYLDTIYATSLMKQYKSFEYQLYNTTEVDGAANGWSKEEKTALWQVMSGHKNVYDYAKKNKTKPVFANMAIRANQVEQAMTQCAFAVAGAGAAPKGINCTEALAAEEVSAQVETQAVANAAKVGSVALVKGEVGVVTVRSLRIGSQEITTSAELAHNVLQKSSPATARVMVDEQIDAIVKAMDMVARFYRETGMNPEADKVLVDILKKRTYVVNKETMNKLHPSRKNIAGLYIPKEDAIYLLDPKEYYTNFAYMPYDVIDVYVHECVHALRETTAKMKGIDSGMGGAMETITEWITYRIALRNGFPGRKLGQTFEKEYIDEIVLELARFQKISVVEARKIITRIQGSGNYEALDCLFMSWLRICSKYITFFRITST